jgi:nucleoside-diphosphate-sugar epimerase
MLVYVTGCNGWIGQKVCKFLVGSGVEVVGGDVQESLCSGLIEADEVEYLSLDIRNPLPRLEWEVDAVVHCAGYAHRPNETPEEQAMFYAVNRDGTKNVLDWCKRQGVGRFLYVSSIAFYDWGRPGDLPVKEDHPVSLPTHYAKSKYEGEVLVRESSIDWRVVRLATVFGDGDRANFSRMARAMKKRMFPILGKGDARKSVIPVDLAAQLIADFCLLDNPPHRLINVGLPSALSLYEITEVYHKCCEFPRCFRVPMPAARLMGAGGSLAAKILGKFPFTSDTLRKLTTDTVVSVDRMLECFPNKDFNSFEDYLLKCKGWYK